MQFFVNTPDVGVKIIAARGQDGWSTILRGEDDVIDDLSVGVGHGSETVRNMVIGLPRSGSNMNSRGRASGEATDARGW